MVPQTRHSQASGVAAKPEKKRPLKKKKNHESLNIGHVKSRSFHEHIYIYKHFLSTWSGR